MMNNNLKWVLLGRGLKSIGDNAFYKFYQTSAGGLIPPVELVISNIDDPMAVTGIVGDDDYLSSTILIVPNSTASKYRATEGWSGFGAIIENLPVPVAGDGDLDGSGSVDGTDVSILLEKVLSGN